MNNQPVGAEQSFWLVRLVKYALGNRFFRFLVVGGINTLFGYGVFALLILTGLHYAWAALISTIAGVLFNFKTTGKFVFQSHDNKLIVRFVLVYALLYGIQVSALKGFELISISALIGGALLLLPMAVIAFILNKRFVFHRS